ncbi:MAG: hypothetical protein INR73_23170 [Williamsia sp.]|nr:hypothetical protein [Williamsia sp.]
MKFVKLLSFFLFGALIFVACQKEYSVETGGLGGIGTSQWSFKEGSVQFKGSMDTAHVDTVAGIAYLTLHGISDSSNQVLAITVFGATIGVGSYSSPSVTFTYTDVASNIIYQNDVSTAGGFTLTITKFDSTGVTGTFSGNAKDAASAAKTIASGRFSASFKKTTTTPPNSTNCKIAKIVEFDTSGQAQGPTTAFTYNASNIVNKVEFLDSVNNRVFNTFSFTFPTNRVQVDSKQYFVTDANGRATEYHGFFDPTSDTTPKIIATYAYSAAGQLTQRKLAYDTAPTKTVLTIDYTWTGNNLTKATAKYQASATIAITLFDVTYEYDNSKTAKNFIKLPAYAYEICFFQSAINTGSVPTNPLTRTTSKYYDITGTGAVTGSYICNFTKYLIDANNYVQSFVTTGDDFDEGYIFSGEKYVFRYRCF